MALVQITSRVGGGISPFIAKGLTRFGRGVPFAVMGVISIISSIAMCALPETKHAQTQEVLEPASSNTTSAGRLTDDGTDLTDLTTGNLTETPLVGVV